MKTRNLGLSALLVGAVIATSGCMMDFGGWTDVSSSGGSTYTPDYGYSDPSYLDIQSGYISGDLGDVTFAQDAWRTDGNDFGSYTQIEVEAGTARDGWAAMHVLNIDGGIHNPLFVPGAALSFDSSSYSGAASVSVVGCSGPSSGTWVFDSSSQQVDVWVDVGSAPNTRRFTYVATFDDGSRRQTTEGTFQYLAN